MQSRRSSPRTVLVFLVAFGLPSTLGGQPVTDLPARDRPIVVDADEVFSVGSIAGEEWETFSRIAGVSFDTQGNLYILDADNFRVLKVDPEGRLVAEMGRTGGGPGEFGLPMGFAVTPEGEVRVFDFGNQGFVVFAPDGSLGRTVPLGGGDMMVIPTGTLMVHPDGGMIPLEDGGLSIRRGAGGGPEIPSTRSLHLFSLDKEVVTRVVYEGWNPVAESRLEMTGGAGMNFRAPPMRAFDPALMVGILSGGEIAIADSSTYQVKVLGVDGTHRRSIRRPISPREVTRRDQEEERRRALERMEASGGPTIVMRTSEGGTNRMASDQARQMMEDRINQMEFGGEIPVLAGLGVDWLGRLWLARSGRRVGEDGPVDVISGAGEYLGTIPPGEFEIPDAFGPGGLVAYVGADEMDVPRVVVKRLQIR